jgi:Domain of unknown function (DUF4258)
MKKRNFIVSILVIIIIIAIWFWNKHNFISPSSNNDLFRNTNHLILTKHAKCRMDCRHITEDEIKEVIHDGKVNYSKSGPGTKGDETYALEGYSNEHQHLRIVVASESDGLVVITCIDLDNEWQCNCN